MCPRPYRIVHSIFAVTMTVVFLSSIFVAPFVSAGAVITAVVCGGWSVLHWLALCHLLVIAGAIYALGPAFRRQRFSST